MSNRYDKESQLPIDISPEVDFALRCKQPVVAFETTILSFGLPSPLNMEVALGCEQRVRDLGAVPATIAMLDGRIRVGLSKGELERFCAQGKDIVKVNPQTFAATLAAGKPGAFTVGACLLACSLVGIRVFATGGIGGIHRHWQLVPDISSDLHVLSKYPVITVSAGIKSILDIQATIEALETLGVPVCGWQTDTFPLFHCPKSDYSVSSRFDTAEQMAHFAKIHFMLNTGGILLTAPIPEESGIAKDILETWIEKALQEAKIANIHGRAITPFLLDRLKEHSQGKSLDANKALIFNNSTIAGKIAVALHSTK